MSEKKVFFVAALTVCAFTLPLFRSGGRGNLTFFGWVKEHTIWGSPIQYVPEEDYTRELEGVKILARPLGREVINVRR